MKGGTDGGNALNREVGTHVFNGYPNEEEWSAPFKIEGFPDMGALARPQMGHLPVWSEGNAYFNGAQPWDKEVNALIPNTVDVKVDLVEKDGKYYLDTDLFRALTGVKDRMISTAVLGKAFEPEEYFENPDGTPITFDRDYFGGHRGIDVIPGPLASAEDAEKALY